MGTEYSLGIDIGATSIKAAALLNGRLLGPVHRHPTIGHNGQSPLEAIAMLAEEIRREQDRPPLAVGAGTPGLVDDEGRLIGKSVNIPGWDGLDLRMQLEQLLGVPARADNDVNMAAYGEWSLGSGGQRRSMVLLALGTGLGGGIVVQGQILRGANGMAGEIGHVVIEPVGRRCNCGLRGCLERYASALGIADSARLLAGDFSGPLAVQVKQAISRGEPGPDARSIYEFLQQGDPLAREIHIITCRSLAAGIGIIAQTLDPEVIVLGGGVMEAGEVMMQGVNAHLDDYVLPMVRKNLCLERAALGELAGVAGAAARAWNEAAGSRKT